MSDLDYKKLLKKILDDTSTMKVVEDRFKLPKAEIFYEGNTTVIKNFDKISDAINRDSDLILKFLLGGLGTAGERDGTRVVFQGKIPARNIQDKLKDYNLVFDVLNELPEKIGMTKITQPYVFPYSGHVPEDKGITGTVIIAESHISIHTFQEKDYCFVDVFSCKDFDADTVAELSERWFSGNMVNAVVIERK